MDAYILTFRGEGPDAPVIPRKVTVQAVTGGGLLVPVRTPPMDAACRSSLAAACEAAKALFGHASKDLRLEIVGDTPLSGGSAGLTTGLLAVSALTGVRLPPFFATGTVLDPMGRLEGGLHAARKAEAAATYAPQLDLAGAVFLCPPLDPVPKVEGIEVRASDDLGAALQNLDANAYAGVAGRHARLRAAARK